ncbi:MAG: aldehyde ferredoxin oxidoreductase C-terminal domain-containing protein, partial [Thermoplasmata archaeon]
PLPSGPAKGETFTKKQLESMIDNYYELRGWDKATGLHLKEKLLELDMKDVLKDLEKRKLVVSSKSGKKGGKGKKDKKAASKRRG